VVFTVPKLQTIVLVLLAVAQPVPLAVAESPFVLTVKITPETGSPVLNIE
jgi:hypothetical protein